MFKEKSKTQKITIIILLLLLSVFAIGLYQYLTKPEFVEQVSLLEELNSARTDEEKSASVEKMLEHLEQKLLKNPDDTESWLILTNSYTTLERYDDALRAIENLYRIKRKDPSVMFRYADIMSMVNNGRFKGKPTELIDEALRIDPTNKNGLWLAGLAAIQNADIKKALKHWQQLHGLFDEDSESQLKIKYYIDLAREQLVETDTESASDLALHVDISLSDTLLNEVEVDDDVFIYAKAIDDSLMPLAVIRKKVSDLPLQVILNDSMALISSNKLSDHKQVQLIARISKSGNARTTPGDLIGILDLVPTNIYLPVKLIIDDVAQ
ncbi:MAG: cytochrome c-type biogenesis protein CcmH [Gammaproteobacteria bacterium]|jgi:cytochrome c-type biogenesis protein CcmH